MITRRKFIKGFSFAGTVCLFAAIGKAIIAPTETVISETTPPALDLNKDCKKSRDSYFKEMDRLITKHEGVLKYGVFEQTTPLTEGVVPPLKRPRYSY